MKIKKAKTSSMGPAFVQLTRILDYCELQLNTLTREIKATGTHTPIPVVASRLGSAVNWCAQHYNPRSEDMLDMTERLVKGWGVDASFVRQSFKFKSDEGELIHLAHTNPNKDEIDFRLPFPHCTLVVDKPRASASVHDPDTNGTQQVQINQLVIYAEDRILDEQKEGGKDWYSKQGLKLGDRFICVTLGLMIDGLKELFLVPAEFHFTSEVPFREVAFTSGIPRGVPPAITNEMEGYCKIAYMAMVIWLMALNSPQVKHDVRTGLKPGVIHTPRRKERVFYEHTLLTIDPSKVVEQTDPLGSHSKHRLHAVRGFWRHYKSGKRAWVKPHWRGDKELGVVTHDYEIKHDHDI